MDAASVVLDWRFLPKWDWYIGTMYSVAFGGIANGDISPQQPRYHERCALPVLRSLQAGLSPYNQLGDWRDS